MKTHHPRKTRNPLEPRRSFRTIVMIAAMLLAPASRAAVLTWDSGGAHPVKPQDGGGIWDETTAWWSDGSKDNPWDNVHASEAVVGNGTGPAGKISLDGAIKVDGLTFNAPGSGSYTITNGTLTLISPQITANADATISSVIAGSDGLVKLGKSALTLAGTNTFRGDTLIHDGRLQLGNGGNAGSVEGNIVIEAEGTLIFNRADDAKHTGKISGDGSVVKAGGNTLTLTETNSYKGGTTVNEGSLLVNGILDSRDVRVAGGAALGGSGKITGDVFFADGALFDFRFGLTLTVRGTIRMDSSFGIASVIGLDSSTSEGTYKLIDSPINFASFDLRNWGLANAYDLGAGKLAYFQQGSLEVVVVSVVPEPGSGKLLVVGIMAALGLRRRVNSTPAAPPIRDTRLAKSPTA